MTIIDASITFDSPYFAAIDLGSNSFHMIVVRILEDQIEIVDREKEMIQLAKGISDTGGLDEAAKIRALSCLSRFAERLRDIPKQQIRAVGTKTLRSVNNSREFISQAEKSLGAPIQIISGNEEARLVYTGFSHSISHDHNQRLVIDIGGGSTEFIIGVDYEPQLLESLAMGCVVFSNFFIKDGVINPTTMRRAYLAGCNKIERIKKRYNAKGWQTAHGTSGTMKAIADLLYDECGGAKITREALSNLYKSVAESGELPKNDLSQQRNDVLPAGIAIVKAIFDQLKLDEIYVAAATLKEGLIYDTIGRFSNHDTRSTTVAKLLEKYNIDTEHADKVASTAIDIWRKVERLSIHGVSRTKILRWASMLHEIGIAVSYSGYHNHGFYILKHSDLAGFGRYEQHILASLVRTHRKKVTDSKFEYMDEQTKAAFIPVLACLRISVVLNRRRENIDTTMDITSVENSISLTFEKNWLKNNPLTFASLKQEISYLHNIGIEFSVK